MPLSPKRLLCDIFTTFPNFFFKLLTFHWHSLISRFLRYPGKWSYVNHCQCIMAIANISYTSRLKILLQIDAITETEQVCSSWCHIWRSGTVLRWWHQQRKHDVERCS